MIIAIFRVDGTLFTKPVVKEDGLQSTDQPNLHILVQRLANAAQAKNCICIKKQREENKNHVEPKHKIMAR